MARKRIKRKVTAVRIPASDRPTGIFIDGVEVKRGEGFAIIGDNTGVPNGIYSVSDHEFAIKGIRAKLKKDN